jgi:hypothetical protein
MHNRLSRRDFGKIRLPVHYKRVMVDLSRSESVSKLTIQRLCGRQNWPFRIRFNEPGEAPKVDTASEGCNSGAGDQRECA